MKLILSLSRSIWVSSRKRSPNHFRFLWFHDCLLCHVSFQMQRFLHHDFFIVWRKSSHFMESTSFRYFLRITNSVSSSMNKILKKHSQYSSTNYVPKDLARSGDRGDQHVLMQQFLELMPQGTEWYGERFLSGFFDSCERELYLLFIWGFRARNLLIHIEVIQMLASARRCLDMTQHIVVRVSEKSQLLLLERFSHLPVVWQAEILRLIHPYSFLDLPAR